MSVKASLLVAVAALVWAAPGAANVVDVRTGSVGTIELNANFGSGVFPDDPSAVIYRSDKFGYGAGFAAFTSVSDTLVYFENGVMSGSNINASRAVTTVDVDIFNDTDAPILDRMVSTLFESSFGFQVSEFGSMTGCSGETLPDCTTVSSGIRLADFVAASGPNDGVAGVSFAFEVLYNNELVRSIGGSITMKTSAGVLDFVYDFGDDDDDDLENALVGFGIETDSDYAHVFKWDTTPFEVLFPTLLAPGESATVTYRITTDSWSQAINPFETNSRNMVIGFACVRDPIGRGGGIASSMLPIFSSLAGNPHDGTCRDDIPDFSSNVLNLPTVENGALVFEKAVVVPEPGTWAMLIAGFGLVGAALRRRPSLSATSAGHA